MDIETVARRAGEGLAKSRLEMLRELGQPIPRRWPAHIVASYVVAEELALPDVDLDELADRIDVYAARAWPAIARRSA